MNELDNELFDFLYEEDSDDFVLFSLNEENVVHYLSPNPENECHVADTNAVTTSFEPTKKSSKPRKYVYKFRSRVYIPKLVKNDIRNLYPTMFANVLNCQDYALWAGFFSTYFHRDLVLHHEFSSVLHPKAPKSLEIQGSALCCETLYSPMQGCPDIIVRLSDVKIRMPSANTSRDSESIIIAKFEVKGTQIRDVPMDTFVIKDGDIKSKTKNSEQSHLLYCRSLSDININVSSSSSNNSSSNSTDGGHIINYISQEGKQEKMLSFAVPKYQEMLDNSPMLSTPVPINISGSFTMHVDKNKVLTRLDFICVNMDSASIQEQMNKPFGAMSTSASEHF